jgi:hypothetical protein
MNTYWQTIDSAPKDGREILVWDGGVYVVHWYQPFLRREGKWYTGFDCSDYGPQYVNNPTHWAECPQGPKE